MCGGGDSLGYTGRGGLVQDLGELLADQGDEDLPDASVLDLKTMDGEGVEELVGEDAAHEAAEGDARGHEGRDVGTALFAAHGRGGEPVDGDVPQGRRKLPGYGRLWSGDLGGQEAGARSQLNHGKG